MKRYILPIALTLVLALLPAPRTAQALAPCPPTAAPAPHTPSSVVTAKRPAFSWGAVAGATSYTLSVSRMSDGATVLSQAGITATFFTPAADLPLDIDLRWQVSPGSPCGPGPSSAWTYFKVSSAPPLYYVDTNGDGVADAITRITTGIQIYHPNSGLTSAYPYSGAQISIAGVKETDGAAGNEVVVIWTEASGVNGIDVIHDRTRTTNRYAENRQFGIYSVTNIDGASGDEIVLSWVGAPGSNGVDVIHDATRVINHYAENRAYAINRLANTDGIVGSEIIIIWSGPSGTNGVDVIHDSTRTVNHYAENHTFGISRVVDTDGHAGAEIVIGWGGAPGVNGVDIIHDTTRTVNHYAENRSFSISNAADADGQPGDEVIVIWSGASSTNGSRSSATRPARAPTTRKTANSRSRAWTMSMGSPDPRSSSCGPSSPA